MREICATQKNAAAFKVEIVDFPDEGGYLLFLLPCGCVFLFRSYLRSAFGDNMLETLYSRLRSFYLWGSLLGHSRLAILKREEYKGGNTVGNHHYIQHRINPGGGTFPEKD